MFSGVLSFPAVWRPSHRESRELSRPFFTDDPRSLVEKGAFVRGVDAVMIGHNKHEGLFYTAPVYKEPESFQYLKCGNVHIYRVAQNLVT